MDIKPDTIKISASHREEIIASHANLYVTIKGSSVFSGNEAMKKAREVSQFVEALNRYGLSPDAVQLQGVRIETSSGPVLKSSSAVYRLKVKTEIVDQLRRAAGSHCRAKECRAGTDRMEISRFEAIVKQNAHPVPSRHAEGL